MKSHHDTERISLAREDFNDFNEPSEKIFREMPETPSSRLWKTNSSASKYFNLQNPRLTYTFQSHFHHREAEIICQEL